MRFPHHPTPPQSPAPVLFWSLMLPRWAVAQRAPSQLWREAETWTCAKCGVVETDIGAAVRHIDRHQPEKPRQWPGDPCAPGRGRAGRRRAAIRPERQPPMGTEQDGPRAGTTGRNLGGVRAPRANS